MNKELILDLISSCILNKELEKNYVLDQVTLRKIKEQTFLPYIYIATKKEKYKTFYLQALLAQEKFTLIGEKIEHLLNEARIPHIFFKGYYLRHFYPDIALRMLGDIDFYVEPKYIKQVKNILINNGFKYKGLWDHHLEFYYGHFKIELHSDLISKNEIGYKRFINPMEHAKLIHDYTYSLEDNYHLLFVIYHYIHHLQRGAGLREVIDIYLLLSKCDIDINYIRENLRKDNLEKFLDCVLTEINVIFSFDKIPYTPNEFYQDVIDYSLDSGIHGNGLDGQWIKNESSSHKNKFLFLLSKVFIPIRLLFKIYPWTKSIILIPVGYFVRFITLLFSKKSRKKLMKAIDSKYDDSIFVKMGIKEGNI